MWYIFPHNINKDKSYIYFGNSGHNSSFRFLLSVNKIIERDIFYFKVFTSRTSTIPIVNQAPPKTDETCIAPTRGTCSFKSGVCKKDPDGVCHWNLVEPC